MRTTTTTSSSSSASPAEIAMRLARVLYRTAGLETVRTLEAIAASLCNRAEALARPDASGRARYASRSAALAALCTAHAGGASITPPAGGLALDPRFGVCLRVASRAIAGALADPTGGAIACHAVDSTPGWARERMPSACVGRFLFYRDAA